MSRRIVMRNPTMYFLTEPFVDAAYSPLKKNNYAETGTAGIIDASVRRYLLSHRDEQSIDYPAQDKPYNALLISIACACA